MRDVREQRQSEKTLGLVWVMMRHLAIEVWVPNADDAADTVSLLKRMLDQMMAEMNAEMKAEEFTNAPLTDEPKR